MAPITVTNDADATTIEAVVQEQRALIARHRQVVDAADGALADFSLARAFGQRVDANAIAQAERQRTEAQAAIAEAERIVAAGAERLAAWNAAAWFREYEHHRALLFQAGIEAPALERRVRDTARDFIAACEALNACRRDWQNSYGIVDSYERLNHAPPHGLRPPHYPPLIPESLIRGSWPGLSFDQWFGEYEAIRPGYGIDQEQE